jgi:hypothetical protein
MDKKITLYRWTSDGWIQVESERGRPARLVRTLTQPRTLNQYPCGRCGRVFAYRKRWTGHECLADLT